MKRLLTAIIIMVSILASCNKDEQPNIIYFLADDMGYGELGSYGQEKIETPQIDQLAKMGMRFTDHYAGSAVCAPSRCILLTGKHGGHAFIRGNHEWGERGPVWDMAKSVNDPNLEGQYPMDPAEVTIAEKLKEAGYKTGMIGKWGLGGPLSESVPNTQGFDFFCGYNCQRQAHTYYPKFLWLNDKKIWLDNKLVVPGTKLAKGADPLDPASYADYTLKQYSPDIMYEQAIKFIESTGDQPFFLYYATTIPHAAIQAPAEWVDKYVEKFGDEEPYLGNKGYFPHRYPHAGYAAMIGYLDNHVGQVIQKLKDLGKYENTIIMFTSDNGPTYNGGTDSPWFNSGGPFNESYGWGKGFLHEGGIRVPMIASWPNHIEPGSTSDHISAFYDVLPTLCEIAGIDPGTATDGISFLPTLLNKKQKEHDYMFWEFPEYRGQQAVRIGKWKGIRKDIKKGNLEIELYNLEDDIREEKNIASEHPDIVEQMRKIMADEHQQAELKRFRMKALGDSL
ncbi:MAG: arylsulfatase [Bacteroidales bacterium]|nr:arylsulfatase [Bacteroidales bacterium]